MTLWGTYSVYDFTYLLGMALPKSMLCCIFLFIHAALCQFWWREICWSWSRKPPSKMPRSWRFQVMIELKEQYPVTAHAPNFDFWTGSRLAEFDTTLKLLRITDQWYIVPVEFRFGLNRHFVASLLLPLTGGLKDGKRFMLPYKLR